MHRVRERFLSEGPPAQAHAVTREQARARRGQRRRRARAAAPARRQHHTRDHYTHPNQCEQPAAGTDQHPAARGLVAVAVGRQLSGRAAGPPLVTSHHNTHTQGL